MDKQIRRLKTYLSQFKTITSRDAYIELGIGRLASRICDLKAQGYKFDDRMIKVRNKFNEPVYVKQYTLTFDPFERRAK